MSSDVQQQLQIAICNLSAAVGHALGFLLGSSHNTTLREDQRKQAEEFEQALSARFDELNAVAASIFSQGEGGQGVIVGDNATKLDPGLWAYRRPHSLKWSPMAVAENEDTFADAGWLFKRAKDRAELEAICNAPVSAAQATAGDHISDAGKMVPAPADGAAIEACVNDMATSGRSILKMVEPLGPIYALDRDVIRKILERHFRPAATVKPVQMVFRDDECFHLNAHQHRGDMHPYTCGNDSRHRPLIATRFGWKCADCDYTQDWAHAAHCDQGQDNREQKGGE